MFYFDAFPLDLSANPFSLALALPVLFARGPSLSCHFTSYLVQYPLPSTCRFASPYDPWSADVPEASCPANLRSRQFRFSSSLLAVSVIRQPDIQSLQSTEERR
jgi:hypothetical protein